MATVASGIPTDTFLNRFADQISTKTNANLIYGQAVERGELTVIPVAKLRFGLGGGSGRRSEQEAGTGGGGGVIATPVGFIEIRKDRAAFRPILDPVALMQMLVGAGVSLWLVLRGIRSVSHT